MLGEEEEEEETNFEACGREVSHPSAAEDVNAGDRCWPGFLIQSLQPGRQDAPRILTEICDATKACRGSRRLHCTFFTIAILVYNTRNIIAIFSS